MPKHKQVMVQVHRPGRLAEAAIQPVFVGLAKALIALPEGTVVDQCPTTGVGMALARALHSNEKFGHLTRTVRVLVSPAEHTRQWQSPEEQTAFRVLSADAHNTEVIPAIRKADNTVDGVAVGRACRDLQLESCSDLLLGWDTDVRTGSTITTLRMALARGLAVTHVGADGSISKRMTPAQAIAWAAQLGVDPWREAKRSEEYDSLLDLV